MRPSVVSHIAVPPTALADDPAAGNPMPVYLAVGRMLLGLVALLAPGPVLRPLVGAEAERPSARYLARTVGVRDLILGALLLRATQTGEGTTQALWIGVACDVLDAKVAFFSRSGLTRWGRRLMMGAAIAYGATGAAQAIAGAGRARQP